MERHMSSALAIHIIWPATCRMVWRQSMNRACSIPSARRATNIWRLTKKRRRNSSGALHSNGGHRPPLQQMSNFTSDAEVAALVEAFETGSIPASEFTHVAHIAVALSYLENLASNQARERMRERIRAFAAHHGAGNLYHETLTTFWMRLLEHVASTSDVDLPLWRRINLIVEHWAKRRPVEAHYSRELIRSQAARDKWVPPDRLPIPF